MFAGRSVRVRWPLGAADYAELFRVVAWGIRDTKGLFGKTSGVEKRGLSSRGHCLCFSGHARDDDFQLVYALSPVALQPTNHWAVDPLLRELDLQLPIRYRYAYLLAYPNILPCRSFQDTHVWSLQSTLLYMYIHKS